MSVLAPNATSLGLFCPYQVAWINDASPLKLAEKSRRIGWSWCDAFDSVENAARSVCDVWYSSADQSAAREYIEYCQDFARIVNVVARFSEGVEVINEREIHTQRLTFENGCKIVAGSSNPLFFRSKGGAAKHDEFAFHRAARELIKAGHATSQFWGYQQSAWSSHNGSGSYFNQLINQAKAGQLKASLHRVTIYDAVEQGIVERILMRKRKLQRPPAPDARARQEWLDDLRSTCPDADIWAEEYECKPSTDGGSLLPYELIQGCEVANLKLIEDPAAVTGTCYAGFDVGRKKDLSVLWVDEKVGDVYWTRCLRVLDKVNFTAQEDLLDRLLANGAVKRLCIDSTGIGMMLAERLQGRWGAYRVEAVNFTAASKSEMAMPFVRRFQDKLARIPMDAGVREDLHSVRKLVTAAGNIRLDADRSEDGHADRFWAGALASHASDQNAVPLPAPLADKPGGW